MTFDDNLREQLSAYQYLRECKIPAVFYSTTLPYLENQVHDVHKMHEIYAKYSDEELIGWLDRRFNFKDHVFTEEAIKNSYKYDLNEKKRIKIFLNFVLSANDRKKAIDQLCSEIILDSDQFRNELYLPMGELRHLAKEGMLGTHTHSHLPLASIPIDKANREILLSVQYLERMTNVKMQSISYPYGRHGAVNRAVAKEAEKIGLRFGLTMHRGINDMNDLRNDSMLLKRIDTNDAPYGKHRSVDFYPEK